MSWMKRRGQPSPNPSNPPVQMYSNNPQQHSIPPQQWQQPQVPQQQYPNEWYSQNRKPEPRTEQQNSPYWHQPEPYNAAPQSANQYQYNQYSSQPNNYYQNPVSYQQEGVGEQYQQNYYAQNISQNTQPNETDPWNWGWDDSNSNSTSNLQAHPEKSNKVITESFANDESWNWTVEEASSNNVARNTQTTTSNIDNINVKTEETSYIKPENSQKRESNLTNSTAEQLPTLPTVRRIKEENLTPQWSIESQVSQDSSDDILLTSESDNRSNILSRSSTISQSPASTHDGNDQYKYEEEIPRAPKEEPVNSEYYQENTLENVDRSLERLSLNSSTENKEVLPQPIKENTPPPPPKATPPLMSTQNNLETSNPYKRNVGLSHKSANKLVKELQAPIMQEPDNFMPNTNVFTPIPQDNISANLETLPDNSERPDQVENIQKPVRKTSTVQQWPENCEIAPMNDRNQYLETGQLSDDNYNSQNSTDLNDSLPPPGLRRLVLGQMEQTESGQVVSDEPPPGLSRMVLGRTETAPTTAVDFALFGNTEEPPVGLHRMVPGESSSPESSSYPRYVTNDIDNYVSETEINQIGIVTQRSATIGADTPPVGIPQNASSFHSSSSEAVISRVGAVGIDSEGRETDVEGANTLDENVLSISSDGKKARDQTVGQNADSGTEEKRKARYQTDSDHEKDRHRGSSSERYEKYTREFDRRHPQKDRESPERYNRDRKYEWRKNKERGYEEDTDYYSDKERDRRHRNDQEEYDRRYNSLRKDYERTDKHREKDRREYRRGGERHEDYYYGRYKEDYYGREGNRSRPSSRSDSMHDSYRERGINPHEREHERPRHRDRDRGGDRTRDHRRPRDPYAAGYYQGYNYDPYNPYYQQYQYQYYENLRRTNPQAYAEWYRKYYQNQNSGAQMAYSTEDRASVHSGRSSANEELNKDRLLDHTDSSANLDDPNSITQRLTPAKFTTAHVKASISSGQFLKILPHYPIDGQPASIEIGNVQNLLPDNEELKELSEFPGPLVKGVTHKKTVIEYCENKIKKVSAIGGVHDVESYILMWELLILLLRQNGMVVGTDIAELLMKNRTTENSRRQSISSSSSAHLEATEHAELINRSSPAVQYKDDFVTEKFREFLIYGSGKEALEWAMKHGLWGHALFLASKLDKRTYANVMMRFANGLTMNDPLQTLYQLLSGKQPAAVTCVADERWGDWRPHLAMILSNTSQRPELDRKAILTLGDTLLSRGSLYAAQFCYLMAQIEFGRYGSQDCKLVLLGSSHQRPFKMFASNEAIFMTEVYEYACSLNDDGFVIPEFQAYKYLVATRLADYGLLEKALIYLERVASGIKQNPSRIQLSVINNVCELADRLRYYDPMHVADDIDSDGSWLTDLRALLDNYNMGLLSQSTTNLPTIETDVSEDLKTSYDQQQQQEQQWQEQQSKEYYQQTNMQSWQSEQQVTEYNQQQQQSSVSYDDNSQQHSMYDSGNYQEQQEQYWNQTQHQQQQQQQQYWDDSAENKTGEKMHHNDYWNNAQHEEPARPLISMPNQTKSSNIYDTLDDEENTSKPKSPVKPKPTAVQNKPASTGWFGGIWSKLAPKPRNQMKLPDDKNPTIVWDSEKKRWVNLEADGDESSTEIKPPPKMSDMFPSKSQNLSQAISTPNLSQSLPVIQNDSAPSHAISQTLPEMTDNIEDTPKPPLQPNMFKLQRGRNLKKSYVDVFNPNGTKANSNVPAPEMFGAAPSSGSQMNYFVPAPISDPNAPTDFLTPTVGQSEENQQGTVAPAMYNPNFYASQNNMHVRTANQ